MERNTKSITNKVTDTINSLLNTVANKYGIKEENIQRKYGSPVISEALWLESDEYRMQAIKDGYLNLGVDILNLPRVDYKVKDYPLIKLPLNDKYTINFHSLDITYEQIYSLVKASFNTLGVYSISTTTDDYTTIFNGGITDKDFDYTLLFKDIPIKQVVVEKDTLALSSGNLFISYSEKDISVSYVTPEEELTLRYKDGLLFKGTYLKKTLNNEGKELTREVLKVRPEGITYNFYDKGKLSTGDISKLLTTNHKDYSPSSKLINKFLSDVYTAITNKKDISSIFNQKLIRDILSIELLQVTEHAKEIDSEEIKDIITRRISKELSQLKTKQHNL